MRVIEDTDTVEFADTDGDRLVLLVAPRQRDLDACEVLERTAAFSQLDTLKALGLDTDAAMKEAEQEAPEVLQAAQEASRSSLGADPKVRLFRLEKLAVRMVVAGEALGGKAILDAYGKMDAASAAWVDGKVAATWDAATPDDASARGAGAHADVPERTAVRSTA